MRAPTRGLLLVALTLLLMTPSRRVPAGTVAEQRARLPPPASCTDPIEGIWKSHDFRPNRGVWERFTLEVRRKNGGDELEGTILNDYWFGGPDDSQPGKCAGNLHANVSMDASGRVDGKRIDFRGVGEWRLDSVLCGSQQGEYVLDVFEGELESERHEFVSVANDRIIAFDEPTVFRRVACLPDVKEDTPEVRVAPPPFYPAEESSGGCAGG